MRVKLRPCLSDGLCFPAGEIIKKNGNECTVLLDRQIRITESDGTAGYRKIIHCSLGEVIALDDEKSPPR